MSSTSSPQADSMLTIQKSRFGSNKSAVNIVPCQIHQTGPSKITKRYWNPVKENDGSQTAYFRGRKLRGRLVKWPQNYHGSVLKSTDKMLTQVSASITAHRYDDIDGDMEEDEEEEELQPVRIVEQISEFDDLIVWGHDQLPLVDDTFVKGLEEWISFAEAIHRSDSETISSVHNGSTPETAAKRQQ